MRVRLPSGGSIIGQIECRVDVYVRVSGVVITHGAVVEQQLVFLRRIGKFPCVSSVCNCICVRFRFPLRQRAFALIHERLYLFAQVLIPTIFDAREPVCVSVCKRARVCVSTYLFVLFMGLSLYTRAPTVSVYNSLTSRSSLRETPSAAVLLAAVCFGLHLALTPLDM